MKKNIFSRIVLVGLFGFSFSGLANENPRIRLVGERAARCAALERIHKPVADSTHPRLPLASTTGPLAKRVHKESGMVGYAFEALVRLWNNRSPLPAELENFEQWWKVGNTGEFVRAQGVAKTFLRRKMLVRGGRPPADFNEKLANHYTNFILMARSVGPRFPNVTEPQSVSAEGAIKRIGPLRNEPLIKIHRLLINQGWNLPLVFNRDRIVYLWAHPECSSVGLVYIDQNENNELYLYKKIFDVRAFAHRKFKGFLPLDQGGIGFADNGALTRLAEPIPLALPRRTETNYSAKSYTKLGLFHEVVDLPEVQANRNFQL